MRPGRFAADVVLIGPTICNMRNYGLSMVIALESLALLLLFVASAFFSSSESAFFSLSPIQVQKIRKSHKRIGRLIE